MLKKVMFVCAMLICMSCARRTIIESAPSAANRSEPTGSTYTVLWANHSSDAGNTNVVNNRLPNGTLGSKSVPLYGKVYANPVIFQDNNGTQYVLVLVKNDDGMTVKCYTDDGNTCEGFNSQTFDAHDELFKHHQMSVTIENDGPWVFVAHNEGVSKFPAFGNYSMTNELDGYATRLLIHDGFLYAQTESTLKRINLNNFGNAASDWGSLSTLANNSTRLPLVISGDFIYVVHGSTQIAKINLEQSEDPDDRDFEDLPELFEAYYTSQSTPYSNNAFTKQRIGLIAAYNRSIIFSVRYEQDKTVNSYNYTLENQILSINYDNANGASLTDYYNHKFRIDDSKISGLVGHPDMTGVPVIDDTQLLLPGVPFSMLQNDLLIENIFTRGYTPSSQTFDDPIGPAEEETIYREEASGFNFYFNYVPMFLIHDSSNNTQLKVLTQHPSSDYAMDKMNEIDEDGTFTETIDNASNKLGSSSSKKVHIAGTEIADLENKEISAVSVGNGLVVMVSPGATDTIHFIK